MAKAKKKAAKEFIAIGGFSGCPHEEFATPEQAAQDVINVGEHDADSSDGIRVYKLVGVYKPTITLTQVDKAK